MQICDTAVVPVTTFDIVLYFQTVTTEMFFAYGSRPEYLIWLCSWKMSTTPFSKLWSTVFIHIYKLVLPSLVVFITLWMKFTVHLSHIAYTSTDIITIWQNKSQTLPATARKCVCSIFIMNWWRFCDNFNNSGVHSAASLWFDAHQISNPTKSLTDPNLPASIPATCPKFWIKIYL